MKQILTLFLILSWAFFLFFYERQANTYIQTHEDISTGKTMSSGSVIKNQTHNVSLAVKNILEDPQVQITLSRIDKDSPKYHQDGVIFANREHLLPLEDQGYYHEWTVTTPGSVDRGARRIIVGKGGEFYFTDDHYAHFTRVK